MYRSLIVAHPATGLRSLEDLIARAGELDFAFVTPTSASGHLIPRALLEGRGMVPEQDFANLVYTMSHTNSAMTILAGKVDAGAISIDTRDRLLEKGGMKPEDLVVLWRSDPVPSGPLMVRRDLPQSLKEAIRQAYLAIDDDRNSPLYRAMQATYLTEDLRFYAVDDERWDGLRAIARNVESMTMLSGE
ncbi:MAG: PhnD/SsuA/transferrin family substrate-binding protein [Gammaproteobacteria bacterium]|nr:PhnD/SsuA/transferrin family substrate-binding protein [Gammaproteobacteria bacterium]